MKEKIKKFLSSLFNYGSEYTFMTIIKYLLIGLTIASLIGTFFNPYQIFIALITLILVIVIHINYKKEDNE